MADLKAKILRAHGGQRWAETAELLASCTLGGLELSSRTLFNPLQHLDVHAHLHGGYLTFGPYPEPGKTACFTPDAVWIADKRGERLAERDTRENGTRTVRQLFGWDQLDLVHHVGTWLWQTLQMPFLLAAPGVSASALSPVGVGASRLQRLKVKFPAGLPVVAQEQVLYCDSVGLVQRVDYAPSMLYGPWLKVSQAWEGHESCGGIVLPTRRTLYPCLATGHMWRLTPLAWLRMDDVTVVHRAADA